MMHFFFIYLPLGVGVIIALMKWYNYALTKRYERDMNTLLNGFSWKIHTTDLTDVIRINFESVPFYLELETGLAENGIYAYNKIVLNGIGCHSGIWFEKGQNVFKAWVEFKKFIKLCDENGVELTIEASIDGKYRDFKKKIESLNNLKVVEKNA